MNHIIFILSHNSKEYTDHVYSALRKQTDNVFVLENSYIPELKFSNEQTIDLGSNNLGVGGFYDYVINNYCDKENLFVGIFNNDITNIPDNLISRVSEYFKEDVGIISPALDDEDCPRHSPMLPIGNVPRILGPSQFVENVVPFYNTKVLKQMQEFVPVHYYGWVDIALSLMSTEMGLKNVVLDDCILTHIRSAIRKDMEKVDKNYSVYMNNAGTTHKEWLDKHPKLKEIMRNG